MTSDKVIKDNQKNTYIKVVSEEEKTFITTFVVLKAFLEMLLFAHNEMYKLCTSVVKYGNS